jgi:hypothetical protein
MDEDLSGGMPGGMPGMTPEMMAQFQEMMKDPAKKAQMENMAKGFMGGKEPKSGPQVEEVD